MILSNHMMATFGRRWVQQRRCDDGQWVSGRTCGGAGGTPREPDDSSLVPIHSSPPFLAPPHRLATDLPSSLTAT